MCLQGSRRRWWSGHEQLGCVLRVTVYTGEGEGGQRGAGAGSCCWVAGLGRVLGAAGDMQGPTTTGRSQCSGKAEHWALRASSSPHNRQKGAGRVSKESWPGAATHHCQWRPSPQTHGWAPLHCPLPAPLPPRRRPCGQSAAGGGLRLWRRACKKYMYVWPTYILIVGWVEGGQEGRGAMVHAGKATRVHIYAQMGALPPPAHPLPACSAAPAPPAPRASARSMRV